MKPVLVLAYLAAALSFAGCDRAEDKSAPQVPAKTGPQTAPAANAPQPEVSAASGDAGLHLNEAKELIDEGKFDEADAKLAQVEAVKDHIPAELKAKLNSLRNVSNAGRKGMEAIKKSR